MLDITTDRGFDIRVLQKVFGVKKIHYFDYDESKQYPYYIPSGKPWRTHQIDAQPVPQFAIEPNADYWVLGHVKDHWDVKAQIRFAAQIAAAVDERRPDDSIVPYVLWYQPGDYARAALNVVGDNP